MAAVQERRRTPANPSTNRVIICTTPTTKRARSLPTRTAGADDRHGAHAAQRSPVTLVQQSEGHAEQHAEQEEGDTEARDILIECVDVDRAAAEVDLLKHQRARRSWEVRGARSPEPCRDGRGGGGGGSRCGGGGRRRDISLRLGQAQQRTHSLSSRCLSAGGSSGNRRWRRDIGGVAAGAAAAARQATARTPCAAAATVDVGVHIAAECIGLGFRLALKTLHNGIDLPRHLLCSL